LDKGESTKGSFIVGLGPGGLDSWDPMKGIGFLKGIFTTIIDIPENGIILNFVTSNDTHLDLGGNITAYNSTF